MSPAPSTAPRFLVAALLLPLAVACGGSGDTGGSGDGDGGDSATLTVLAATSLTDVFTRAGEVYEDAHPGVTVRFSFAGSQELAAQVTQGAPADVLVTADARTMADVAGETGEPAVIARNELVIVTPPDNPADVADLADLADPALRLVLAAPEVPAGRYGQQILDAQGLDVTPDSQEPNVRAVLGKVQLGEADAGLVYVTDATAAGDAVRAVPIPAGQNVTAEYPAAALNGSDHADQAQEFVDWLTTPEAEALLTDAGFRAP
ncbi:molybdate ABC transporter substrate-binding protein [Streptomyces sp. NBC_01803]|uniref:molybdate ABC transporter substrate-binding protein n=1 Tax=Streptomyces sp. NBC_01803 TaxID=2975946 RepID=UPI002DDA90A9|nr:molybdate ABC transporter substrate-binding protein [Streptomyces sp. NBC_01803]WSA46044.1 molybdate ABC transporter substrate-binding protein [Streptomyces sp. NBC_01803]